MMSLQSIIAMNEEIAAKAARRGDVPFVPCDASSLDSWRSIPFPNLGYYEPPNWEKTDTSWFVDKTGWGTNSEPALTVPNFKSELKSYIAANPGDGFAITEEGPFQIFVTAFRRIKD